MKEKNNTSEKSRCPSRYVFWDQSVTIYLPYKNFVLEISIREEANTKRTRVDRNMTNEGDVESYQLKI